MFQSLLAPITDFLSGTVPAPTPQLDAARGAAGDAVIWSGTQLSGEPLRHAIDDVSALIVLTALSAAVAVSCLITLLRATRKPSPVFLVPATMIVLTLGMGETCRQAYGKVLDQATTAVAISPARVVLADSNGRTDIPASALTRVQRVNGERAVTLRFQFFQSLRIEPGMSEFGALDSAVDRLAEEAGSRSPLKRDTLG